MRPSKDPILLACAKGAQDIVWGNPPFHPDVVRIADQQRMLGKRPKHVRLMPSGKYPYLVGFGLKSAYRPIAYVASWLHAAMLADLATVRISEFRQKSLLTNPEEQKFALNFPIEHCQEQVAGNESLSFWWSNVFSHLLETGVLVERVEPAGFRPGRHRSVTEPQLDAAVARLEARLSFLESRLSFLESRLNFQVYTPPPQPAQPADYPFFTWTSNNQPVVTMTPTPTNQTPV